MMLFGCITDALCELFALSSVTLFQAHNQLGTPERAKTFLGGPIFLNYDQ